MFYVFCLFIVTSKLRTQRSSTRSFLDNVEGIKEAILSFSYIALIVSLYPKNLFTCNLTTKIVLSSQMFKTRNQSLNMVLDSRTQNIIYP